MVLIVEPRRRDHIGRRGYSPRRTQSSSNASRVEMYFSEMDVDVRQPRSRESVASLTYVAAYDRAVDVKRSVITNLSTFIEI